MQSLKNRVVRVSDETWLAAKATAEKEGTTVSAIVRRLLSAYVRAGSAVVLVLAAFALSACGGAESPVAGRTAQVGTPAPGTSVEPSAVPSASPTADCWTDPSGDPFNWRTVFNEISGDPVYAVAYLESLPAPTEGCTEVDRESLAQSDVTAAHMRESFPDLFTD